MLRSPDAFEYPPKYVASDDRHPGEDQPDREVLAEADLNPKPGKTAICTTTATP